MPPLKRTSGFASSVFFACCIITVFLTGCVKEEPPNIPKPSAEAIAREAAITKRMEELKKDHPDVPAAALYDQASRESAQGNAAQK